MKKIINGKMYNTETAKEISEWSEGVYRDFTYIGETLYRKRTGEYFLYGESGAAGKYAKKVGCNNWSDSAAIIPFTKDQAKEWLEKHGSAEEYIEEFGEPEE